MAIDFSSVLLELCPILYLVPVYLKKSLMDMQKFCSLLCKPE